MGAETTYRVAPTVRGGWNAFADTPSGSLLLNASTDPYPTEEEARARVTAAEAARREPPVATPAPTQTLVIGACPVADCERARRNSVIVDLAPAAGGRQSMSVRLPAGPRGEIRLGSFDKRSVRHLLATGSDYLSDFVAAVDTVGWVCHGHHRFMRLAVIVGEFRAGVACSHRCWEATSARCVCACAGARHGQALDSAMVSVGTLFG